MSGWLGRGGGRRPRKSTSQREFEIEFEIESGEFEIESGEFEIESGEFEIESGEFEIESASAKADLFYVGEQKWSVTGLIFGKRLAIVAKAPEETLSSSLESVRVGDGNNGG